MVCPTIATIISCTRNLPNTIYQWYPVRRWRSADGPTLGRSRSGQSFFFREALDHVCEPLVSVDEVPEVCEEDDAAVIWRRSSRLEQIDDRDAERAGEA